MSETENRSACDCGGTQISLLELPTAKGILRGAPPVQEAGRAGMLTSKGKYGLKALIYLARLPNGETTQIADIAAKNNISKKFLDAILLDLRHAGFVRSRKGPGGGYSLARPASEIFVGAVVRALDGPLAPIACASRTAYEPCDDCDNSELCGVRLIMTDVRDAIANILDRTSLATLVERTQTDGDAWDFKI